MAAAWFSTFLLNPNSLNRAALDHNGQLPRHAAIGWETDRVRPSICLGYSGCGSWQRTEVVKTFALRITSIGIDITYVRLIRSWMCLVAVLKM
jgi:hypothetical protein